MRITSLDRLVVAGREYCLTEVSETSYAFEAPNAFGVRQVYTFEEFAQLLRRSDVEFEPLYHLPGRQDAREGAGTLDLISGLPERPRSETVWRHAIVTAFLELERRGEVKRVPSSIREALPKLEAHVNEMAKATQRSWRSPRAGRWNAYRSPPCERSLRTWLRRYEMSGCSILALVPRTHRSGNRDARYCAASLRILGAAIGTYLIRNGPNKSETYKKYKELLSQENDRRSEDGLPPLPEMAQRKIERTLKGLDPYSTKVHRRGVDEARHEFVLYETGIDVSYPMERIEVDEWKIDVISIFSQLGLLNDLSDEELAGLERGRRWLYLAIDCATRCVLGMRIARAPNPRDAVELLADITRDKSDLAEAAGCMSRWHHHGGLAAVVTDLGAAFVSDEFRAAVLDAHGNPETPPGGLPWLRSRVERIFGTISSALMPLLSGRTSSNPILRGDYPAEQLAALSDDVLMELLTIYIVDIYHNMPHEGLDGETPNNCWNRLSSEKGVVPALSQQTRCLAFGLKDKRRVSGRGVRKFGIDYVCPALRDFHLHSHEQDVAIRVDLRDLGWIMVRVDRTWHVARALQKCAEGVSFDTWSAAVRSLRQKHHDEAVLHERTVFEALRRIIAINEREATRFGTILAAQTPESLERAHDQLFLGLSITPDRDDVLDLPTDDSLHGRIVRLDEPEREEPTNDLDDRDTDTAKRAWRFDDDE
ncbi:Mu transposase C-terminal domain-containing protein [Jannaschia marina]|uniref:Mu transposase C-terminal domain-containing protein n=1 Tax=Jannaschia marina TaxID=2741674 RepID=UPI0015C842D0|nr:Mu transposase C-terminal domain-containing protein [Jannaschia marina]